MTFHRAIRYLRLSLVVLLAWGVTARLPVAAAAPGKVGVVAFALWSDQGVFLSEATQAARLMAARYGQGPMLVRANSRRALAAGPTDMLRAIGQVERELDPARDTLVVILTSHGSPEGIAEKGGRVEGLLSPTTLASLLQRSRTQRKVLIVSACFAGIFAPLATPDLLVITAADATHPSFGCSAGARWTYFGDAFFNQALRRGTATREPIDRVYANAATLVRAREVREGFEPSNPQIAGGANVLDGLKPFDAP